MLLFFDPTTLQPRSTIDDPAPPEAVVAARTGVDGPFLRTRDNYSIDAVSIELRDAGLAVVLKATGQPVPLGREMTPVFSDDGSKIRGLPYGTVLRYNGAEFPVPPGEEVEILIDTPGSHRFEFVAPGFLPYVQMRVVS